MRYRKRPVVVDAIQWTGSNDDEIRAFIGGATHYFGADWRNVEDPQRFFVIRTREGDMMLEQGNWLIRGVRGELYPCRQDVFAATYERVEELS